MSMLTLVVVFVGVRQGSTVKSFFFYFIFVDVCCKKYPSSTSAASECKPCVKQCASVAGPGSASSLSPPSITEDIFFSSMTEEKDEASSESDYEDPGLEVDSSADDILGLDSSLRGTEFFKDLQEGDTLRTKSYTVLSGPRSAHSSPVSTHHLSPGPHRHMADSSSCPGSLAYRESPVPPQPDTAVSIQCHEAAGPVITVSTTVYLRDLGGGGDTDADTKGGGDLETDIGGGEEGMDSGAETFPILVRSMSTSRRHSWEVPLSPFDPGRR
ncbi:uncharacterized protein LOC118771255 [Megalops cyprinoides]|uniref:uncharacterized protein LOC118771255 n=1 Tax=Megalops cyprinoides TaxID=118141 RepID=UPI0018646B2B|nr:uncharacterized protein LOC118771255 [Megalops cyprinoides]